MKVETPIAQIIRTATEQNIHNAADSKANDNQKTLFDTSCKRILSIKIFLAWIMKSCMEEYKDCDVNDIAERYIEGEPEISTTPMLPDENILINGVARAYAMTGWRIGYLLSGEKIAKVMANYLSHSTGSPSSVSQAASVAALNGPQDCVETMRRAFEERRNYIVDRVNAIDGVSCIKPEGAFYIMMNVEKQLGRTIHGELIQSGDDFSAALLKHGLVATVPCSGFGAPNFVRWSYATSMDNIKKGMDRLEEFLKG